MTRALPIAALLLVLVASSLLASRETLALRAPHATIEGRLSEPLPVLPASFVLGQKTTLADLYWLNLLAYVGHPHHIAAGWPRLPQLLDRVIATDPDFAYPYQAGGLLLVSSERFEKADEVLGQATERFPSAWVFPFYAGFNAWQGLGEIDRAAGLFFRAGQIPDGPPMLSALATRLMATGDRLDQAILLVEATLTQPQPPLLYERFAAELAGLRVERDLRLLESAHSSFVDQVGRAPAHLAELLAGGRELSLVAARIEAQYDPATTTYTSPLLPRRVVLGEVAKGPPPEEEVE